MLKCTIKLKDKFLYFKENQFSNPKRLHFGFKQEIPDVLSVGEIGHWRARFILVE